MTRSQRWICGFFISLFFGFIPKTTASASPFMGIQSLQIAASSESAVDQQPEDQVIEIPLVNLGLPDNALLNMPYQENEVKFNLPPDWELTQAAVLELHVTSEFFSLMEVFTEGITAPESTNVIGSLEITLNERRIKSLPISKNGDFTFTIEIPTTAISGPETVQTLNIGWDANLACQYNIASVLTIKPDSLLRFTYQSKPIHPGIAQYPAPFFLDHNIAPDSTAIIIPSTPSEQELSTILSVAAGLGNHSDGSISYKIFLADQIKSGVVDADHIILVGNAASLESVLRQFDLENKVRELLNTIHEDSGLVLLGVSPWNPGRAVMVVTGKNDSALRKAGSALGSRHMMPFAEEQYANINDINTDAMANQYQIDQTLLDLGGQDVVSFSDLGETIYSIPFAIPSDISISPESYMEIYFRHSQLLDYLRSSMTVLINGTLIGNIQFSDQSIEKGVARFVFPPNSINSSNNMLSIKLNLASQDICGDSRSGNYWASIFGDSYLHLPPVMGSLPTVKQYFLSDFPQPFINNRHLENVTFIIEQDDPYALEKAFDIAFRFGSQNQSELFIPSAIFSDSLPAEMVAGNYLVIGLSARIPFTSGINKILPFPFNTDGNLEGFERPGVSFDLNKDQDLGFLEIIQLAANDVYIINILGNTRTGLDNAVRALTSEFNSDQLRSMNIAVVTNEGQITGFHYQRESSETKPEEEAKTGFARLLLTPENYTFLFLIIVLGAITGLLLWPVFSRKRNE